MRLGNETKVGLVVFAAFLALVAIYWFLGSSMLQTSTYRIYAIFPNVQKLDKGADVRLAGVKIGTVSEVVLTPSSQARVNMLIDNGNKIPENSGARITTGAVIGDSFVEIVPGDSKVAMKPGSRIKTISSGDLTNVMADASALIIDLRTATQSVNRILNDKELIGSVKSTVKGLDRTAEATAALVQQAQGMLANASPQINDVFSNLAQATENAISVSRNVDEMLAQDVRPNVKGMMGEVREASEGLNKSIQEARDMLASFKDSTGKVASTLEKVDAAACQAQLMMTNLNEASASVKELATDAELKNNIKATVRNAAQASAEARNLMCNINKKVSGFGFGPTPEQKSAIPDYGMSENVLWKTGEGGVRLDANYTFAGFNSAEFYRAGLYDFGKDAKFNLMAGNVLNRQNAYRYGLYASRLGVGYDWRPSSKAGISMDVFGTSDTQMELRGIFGISGPFNLYAGAGNMFGGPDKNPTFGLHYAK